MFCKNVIKKPYMFRSLLYDHPQGLSSVLSALPLLRLLASSFTYSVCGRMPSMCMCVWCTCLWIVWLFTTRQPTGTVRGTARRPHFSLSIISVTVQLWI
jgi:hypothetical protein